MNRRMFLKGTALTPTLVWIPLNDGTDHVQPDMARATTTGLVSLYGRFMVSDLDVSLAAHRQSFEALLDQRLANLKGSMMHHYDRVQTPGTPQRQHALEIANGTYDWDKK